MKQSRQRLLLDVNVWIALLDDDHVHNHAAHQLIASRPKVATCPLTENGTLRVLNLPGYTRARTAGYELVRDKLAAVCADLDHEFWPDDISLRSDDVLDWRRISGHNQLTDAYLLALAVKHGGALASFDRRIAHGAVRDAAPNNLILL